ncbi:MAG: hypothetical protein ABI593_00520 [Betaproteobacteria bacterium]
MVGDGATADDGGVGLESRIGNLEPTEILDGARRAIPAGDGQVGEFQRPGGGNLEHARSIRAAQRDEIATLDLGVGRDRLVGAKHDNLGSATAIEGDDAATGVLRLEENGIERGFGTTGGRSVADDTARGQTDGGLDHHYRQRDRCKHKSFHIAHSVFADGTWFNSDASGKIRLERSLLRRPH